MRKPIIYLMCAVGLAFAPGCRSHKSARAAYEVSADGISTIRATAEIKRAIAEATDIRLDTVCVDLSEEGAPRRVRMVGVEMARKRAVDEKIEENLIKEDSISGSVKILAAGETRTSASPSTALLYPGLIWFIGLAGLIGLIRFFRRSR